MYTKTSGGVTTTYTYDGAGRLTSESSATSSTSYAYDAANNRTSMVNNGTLTTYTYDANNRMLTETEGGTTKAYTYDANGNQLTGDGATYTYNARGQQTGYSKGSVTASYTYLPTGLCKSKTVGITTTNYVWDGQNMVYEYDGTNSTGGTAYYYGLTLISQGNYAYYLYNAHGDVVQLVSSTGSLGLSYNYDAFGNEVNPSATDTNPFRYAGQYFDSETGTYYLRARYYAPSVGRFTQRDTHWNIGNMLYGDTRALLGYVYIPNRLAMVQSQNSYIYCVNTPTIYVDTSGNWIHIAIGAGIGLLSGGIISAATQYLKGEKIDWGKIAISAVTGALSGALAATGVGLVGQIAGNTVLGAASSFTEEIYINNGDITKTNITEVMKGAVLGAAGGLLGGAGGGSKHLDKLANQMFKRIGNAFLYKTGNALKKEIANAFSYYVKSAGKADAEIVYAVFKACIPAVIKGGGEWIDKLYTDAIYANK